MASRPRVLHVLTDRAPRGAQTSGLALSDDLCLRGWDSSTVALRGQRSGSVGLPVSAIVNGQSELTLMRRLRREAAGHDVVVAHGSSTLRACAAALVGGPPFVYVNIGDLSVWLDTRVRKVRTRALMARAAGVAAISQRSRDYLVERMRLPADRVRVLPNFRDPGIHERLAATSRDELRRGLGWPVDRPVALYLGSLTEEKRPDLAIDVARRLPHVQVVLAGPGSLAPATAEAARSAGVMVTGATDMPERALAAADVLLLTSDTEGLPGVLIEAGMARRPAVTTDVGFVDEAVVDGVTGRLAPRGDSVALAAGVDEALRKAEQWGSAAYQHCRSTFGADVVVPRWEEFLHSVAGGAGWVTGR